MTLSSKFANIIKLQTHYTRGPSTYMDERKSVLSELKKELTLELSKHQWAKKILIATSLGIRKNPMIPWVRFYDPVISPSAIQGWYVVILFPFRGSEFYLSLNQGTNKAIDNDLKREPLETINSRAHSARLILESMSLIPNGSMANIELHAPQTRRNLAKGYEMGNILAFEYNINQTLTTKALLNDLRLLWNCIPFIRVESSSFLPGKRYEKVSLNHVFEEHQLIYVKDPDKQKHASEVHFGIQNKIAAMATTKGLDPLSPLGEPKYDIAWQVDKTLYVIEIKSLPADNEVNQLRLGLGQILHYRQQLQDLYPDLKIVGILACERRTQEYKTWKRICDNLKIILTYGPRFKSLFDHFN